MKEIYRQLFRHSAVYALGQLLARLASVLLLPVYTRYLRPADYAAIAIVDLTTGILSILIGSGIAAALTRHHFDHDSVEYRNRLWSTGIVWIAATATIIVLPAWLLRGFLADALLGPEVPEGAFYFALALPQLWSGTIGQIPEAYLRVQKRSGLYVLLNLLRLIVNIAFNLLFLVWFEMGVVAILLGNLLASILHTSVQLSILARGFTVFTIDRDVTRQLWLYGRPLIITALLSLLMHNGDRYILRFFVEMNAIGIYSLAYVLGQSVNTMLLFPFSAIWNVTIYDIAAGPEPERMFADVFRRFFDGISLIMLGVSLFAHQLLELLVAPDYWPAADLVPIVCLAYVFFSLHDQFRVPALLSKRTATMLPVFLAATAMNVAANFAFVPSFGIAGAAWASVVTFAVFSMFGLLRYRKIARYPYPLARCFTVLAGMILTYGFYRGGITALGVGPAAASAIALLLWSTWAIALFIPQRAPFSNSGSETRRSDSAET